MSRRIINMVTAALLLIGLGFVVAVAARTLPGDGGEPLLDVSFEVPDFIGASIRFAVLALAALGALIAILSIAKAAPRQRTPLRRFLGIVVWAIVFFIVYQFAQPGAQEALSEVSSEVGGAGDPDGSAPVTAAAWMVSLLLAAIVAAALVRIGVSIRAGDWSFESADEADDQQLTSPGPVAEPVAAQAGTDPWSRVVNTYSDFETEARDAGLGRLVAETPRQHAERAGGTMDVKGHDLDALSSSYEAARFAGASIGEADAERAESAWERLKARMRG